MMIFLASSLSLLVSALVLGLLSRLAPQVRLMDYPGDRRRLHRQAVPLIGGLAIFAGLLAGLSAVAVLPVKGYGLAGGITLITLGSTLFFLPVGSALPIVLSATLAALVPYLICNLDLVGLRHKVFLGDAGSMLLGFLIVWGLIRASRVPGGIAPVTALWMVAVPVMDTLAVMGQRLAHGRHPFSADSGHVHHRLSRLFKSTRRALIVLLLLAALLAAMGLVGEALDVAEAVMFYLALAVFIAFLVLINRLPAWYQPELKRSSLRQAPQIPLAEGRMELARISQLPMERQSPLVARLHLGPPGRRRHPDRPLRGRLR